MIQSLPVCIAVTFENGWLKVLRIWFFSNDRGVLERLLVLRQCFVQASTTLNCLHSEVLCAEQKHVLSYLNEANSSLNSLYPKRCKDRVWGNCLSATGGKVNASRVKGRYSCERKKKCRVCGHVCVCGRGGGGDSWLTAQWMPGGSHSYI